VSVMISKEHLGYSHPSLGSQRACLYLASPRVRSNISIISITIIIIVIIITILISIDIVNAYGKLKCYRHQS